MSLFDNLKAIAAQAADLVQSNPRIIEGIQKIVEDHGGVSGLVQKFKDKGFADVASSWIGTGENTQIGADDLIKVLGKDAVEDLAGKAGLEPELAAGLVSNLLPIVIDKLSPEGKEPKDDVTGQLSSLASLFLK